MSSTSSTAQAKVQYQITTAIVPSGFGVAAPVSMAHKVLLCPSRPRCWPRPESLCDSVCLLGSRICLRNGIAPVDRQSVFDPTGGDLLREMGVLRPWPARAAIKGFRQPIAYVT